MSDVSSFIFIDNQLNTRQVIDVGVITYVLACLASDVADVRAAARFILHEFRQHMESSVYSETAQVLELSSMSSLTSILCPVGPISYCYLLP